MIDFEVRFIDLRGEISRIKYTTLLNIKTLHQLGWLKDFHEVLP